MSTKEYGCFFCAGKSTDESGTCPTCGFPINIGAELLKMRFGDYAPAKVLGRGFYGWTLKVEDAYQPFSMKIIPQHRLEKDSLGEEEARAMVACSPHRNIARFVRRLTTDITLFGKTEPVLCLVFDYIDKADPLRKLVENIANTPFEPTKSDVIDILAGIASGLARMHSRGLWHDDLHDDNVLVRSVASDENLPEKYEAKLIDFGSVKKKLSNEPEHGTRSDYMYLSKHVFTLAARFEEANLTHVNPVDRSFLRRLREFGQRLMDPNVSRRNLSPDDIVLEFKETIQRAITGNEFPSFDDMKKQSRVSLNEPLANTNAISLAPQDIALLFRDRLGWIELIKKSEPVLVVGPRGCGKTMLLRYLSISSDARPRKTEEMPRDVSARLYKAPYIGFLVRLVELRTPFLRSAYKRLEANDKALAEDFCREFININFVYEVLRTLTWLKTEHLADITSDELRQLTPVVARLMSENGSRTDKSATLDEIVELIERRVAKLSNLPTPEAYRPTNLCRDDVLIQLARTIKSLEWLKPKEVWFLFDDYSPTLLPSFTIKSYNPVIFRLSNDVKITLSSEGNGPVFDDTLGRRYKEGREMSRVNLGEVYFRNREEVCLEFFEQILTARFEETGKGSLKELRSMLGEHESDSNFGQYLMELSRPGDARFNGFKLLCRLCSGDVSYIIELLHSLSSGRWGSAENPIRPIAQDEVTKQFAHRQLALLQSTSDYGPKLYQFAEGLGNLLKEYLLKSKDKSNPDERLRIEIEGPDELSPEAMEMQEQLFRHSVLIPGGMGKSRKGLPTRKLYFRRLYAPCFPFSPNRGSCIDLNVKEFEQWLVDPSRIWKAPPPDAPLLGLGVGNDCAGF